MIEVGHIVDDRYEVLSLLGQGGLASVYRVRHTALGSYHALKVMTLERKGLDRRLLLEGRIQAQLRHPNIVSVTDVLRVDGRAALLMEFVDGPALDAWLAENGPMGVEPALDLFAPILAAVVTAHDAGVLHRDLKPQNVILARQGSEFVPKVADFGLAKVLEEEIVAGATRAGAAMGTPGYMAPEQLRDAASADERSDVFALGAILHELITGKAAFADEHGHIDLTATIERTAAPLEGVPEHLKAAVERALSPRPDDRQPNARALAEELLPEGDPRRARTLAAATQPVSLHEPNSSAGPNTWRSSVSVPAASTLPSFDAPNTLAPPSVEVTSSPAPAGRSPLVLLAVGGVVAMTALLGLVVVGAAGAAFFSTRGGEAVEPVAAAPTPDLVVPAPEPVVAPGPEPEVAAVEAGDDGVVAVEAAPSPVPTGSPSPSAASSPLPVPIAGPPPAPAPVGVGEEVEPVVVPEPAGVNTQAESAAAEAARVAMAERMTRELVGTWKGQAQGRPFQLKILSANPDLVRADVVFNPGPAQQITAVSGRYESGALTLSDGTLNLSGTVAGDKLTGTYDRGRKPVSFDASR